MQRDVAGGCGKIAVIMAATVTLSGLAALVAGNLRQMLRLFLQQFVERFFDAAAHGNFWRY